MYRYFSKIIRSRLHPPQHRRFIKNRSWCIRNEFKLLKRWRRWCRRRWRHWWYGIRSFNRFNSRYRRNLIRRICRRFQKHFPLYDGLYGPRQRCKLQNLNCRRILWIIQIRTPRSYLSFFRTLIQQIIKRSNRKWWRIIQKYFLLFRAYCFQRKIFLK